MQITKDWSINVALSCENRIVVENKINKHQAHITRCLFENTLETSLFDSDGNEYFK